MTFEDFALEDHLASIFDALYQHTQAQVSVHVELRFSDANDLRITSILVDANLECPRFAIIISRRLVNLVGRCFFCFVKSAAAINGVQVANPVPIEIDEPFFGEIDSLELHLSRLPDEAVIDDERVEIFLSCLSAAWSWLLLHEFAHITQGHLLFIGRENALFRSDPAFSRAMEAEADDRAADWFMAQKIVNPPPVMIGGGDYETVVEYPAGFAALIVSVLYLLLRLQPSTVQVPKAYLPVEVRHAMAVIGLLARRQWSDGDAKSEAILRALTEASNILRLITGLPKRSKPAMISEMPFEEQITRIRAMAEDHVRLQNHWLSHRLGGSS